MSAKNEKLTTFSGLTPIAVGVGNLQILDCYFQKVP